jgi:hypothetical protein
MRSALVQSCVTLSNTAFAGAEDAPDPGAQQTSPVAPASPQPATVGASALPYGGDINAAMKAQDRAAIRVIMERRQSSGLPSSSSSS